MKKQTTQKRVPVTIDILPALKKKMKTLALRDDMKLRDKYEQIIEGAR